MNLRSSFILSAGFVFLLTLTYFNLSVVSQTLPSRTKTSLNPNWRFVKGDPAGAEKREFDDGTWESVGLPHTWNAEDPWDDEPGYYRGTAWYRRELPIAKTLKNKRLFLYFEGANQVADVYVNGRKAGTHIGGYTAFSFDITDLVEAGERNIIAVRVDNGFNEDIPPLTADFNFYGGIYRDVWLIATNDLHFTTTDLASPGVRISTPDIAKGIGTVAIDGTIVNAGSQRGNFEVVSSVYDAANRKIAEVVSRIEARPGSETKFSTSGLTVRAPKLWSPQTPYLYSVRCAIRENGKTVDEIIQPLGFRWFKFDGEKGFSLNGKSLKLRGTNRHQDYAGLGNAVPDRLQIRDMELIKAAGFNFIRLAHYPQDPSVLEAADRLGLLIWEETPIVNYITKSKAFTENSLTMVREMIRQHRNHPSILMWGYMNEIFLRVPKGRDELYPATVELARELNRTAKEEDPTRPTTIAFHGSDVYNTAGLGDIPDIIGWNLYSGWYSGDIEGFGKFLDTQHQRYPKRPLIVSEYGANGDLRLHSTEPRRFDSTIEYQLKFHESYLAQINARPYVAGSALWNQFDFGSESRGETIPHLNQKGMYTFDRRPKDVHFFYKASFSKTDVVHIAVRDWPLRAGPAGKSYSIDVYSNLPEVELIANGHSLGRKPVDGSRKVTWEVKMQPGVNKFIARGLRSRKTITDTAVIEYQIVTVDSPEIAVNVGSNADFIDADRRVWLADQTYRPGSWGFIGEKTKWIYSSSSDRNIPGTISDPLFQTMQDGLGSYRFDVPEGRYTVELLFAETRFETAGKRVFNVNINGRSVIEKLDLAASPGPYRAFSKQFTIDTKNGIVVGFLPETGTPILSGIRIVRQ
ncbi:MAG TPA: glycoside hydrolase family 2 TIM barrel-domain containing protein [Pyrinomonadaceae bacterium]|jgi:beta-galactosidase|nr:glycoside hydrolase family 2 TIM barrel-domain containing protein [Pyrinomonadaceae bacterium]